MTSISGSVTTASVTPAGSYPPPLKAIAWRELWVVAFVGIIVVVTHFSDAGVHLLEPWLGTAAYPETATQAFTLVTARLFPWIAALPLLSLAFSLRWLPRIYQRLVEPSLIAAWVTVFASIAITLLLKEAGLISWTWMSLSPENAILLNNLNISGNDAAIGLWIVISCLLIPIIQELLFRFAIIEFLTLRGFSEIQSIFSSAACFAIARWLVWHEAGLAALQHATFAFIASLVLGLLVIKGKRGRGLGLAVIAHACYTAVENGELLLLLR